MKPQHTDYQVIPYPKYRRFLAAAYRSTLHKPMIHGLIEVDVSGARAFLRDQKAKTGEALSFTAFLIACLAKAVEEHKAVQAIRKGRKRLILPLALRSEWSAMGPWSSSTDTGSQTSSRTRRSPRTRSFGSPPSPRPSRPSR